MELHKMFWNVKRGETGYVYFILVTMRGRIVFVSDLTGGNTQDGTQFNSSGVAGQLEQKYGERATIEGEW